VRTSDTRPIAVTVPALASNDTVRIHGRLSSRYLLTAATAPPSARGSRPRIEYTTRASANDAKNP